MNFNNINLNNMNFSGIRKIVLIIMLSLLVTISAGLGISLGFALAQTRNIQNTENLLSLNYFFFEDFFNVSIVDFKCICC